MSIGTLAPPIDVSAAPAAASSSRVWRKLARNPAALAGALILLCVIGAAVFANYVSPHEPARQSHERPPCAKTPSCSGRIAASDAAAAPGRARQIW